MNRHLLIAITIACGAAVNAFAAGAGDITIDPNPFVSTTTRAAVRDELAAFRQAGVNPWADEYNQLSQYHGMLTRAEVKADFMAGRNEVGAFSGEDSGSVYLARAKGRTMHRGTELAHAE